MKINYHLGPADDGLQIGPHCPRLHSAMLSIAGDCTAAEQH
jgi:hypothetical protein